MSNGQPEPQPDQRWTQPKDQQWTQPDFASQPDAAPSTPPVVTGPILLPAGAPPPPPTALESGLRIVARLVWPVMILLALMGGSWWMNILIAIIASTILDQVVRELRRRRLASFSAGIVPPKDFR